MLKTGPSLRGTFGIHSAPDPRMAGVLLPRRIEDMQFPVIWLELDPQCASMNGVTRVDPGNVPTGLPVWY